MHDSAVFYADVGSLSRSVGGRAFVRVQKRQKRKVYFYAVATGGYSDITLARNNAELVKQRGGAGYVIAGDSIELIFAVYKSEDEANSALSALGNRSAYIKKSRLKRVVSSGAKTI